jgi:uncharacterized Zn finger protein
MKEAEKIICSFCGKEITEDEVYAYYGEDDTVLCKNCFGAGQTESPKENG